jgi:general secretion pathway protein H
MTRISATGNEEGFTLTEILVVMVILGLLTTAVLMAAPSMRVSLADEAERFAAKMVRARDEAVLSNRTIEMRVTPKGYEFDVARRGGRQKLIDEPFGLSTWSEDTSVAIKAADGRARVTFDPTGITTPATIDLSRADVRVRVIVDGAGNVSVDGKSS